MWQLKSVTLWGLAIFAGSTAAQHLGVDLTQAGDRASEVGQIVGLVTSYIGRVRRGDLSEKS